MTTTDIGPVKRL